MVEDDKENANGSRNHESISTWSLSGKSSNDLGNNLIMIYLP
jgi:hypothetical protein